MTIDTCVHCVLGRGRQIHIAASGRRSKADRQTGDPRRRQKPGKGEWFEAIPGPGNAWNHSARRPPASHQHLPKPEVSILGRQRLIALGADDRLLNILVPASAKLNRKRSLPRVQISGCLRQSTTARTQFNNMRQLRSFRLSNPSGFLCKLNEPRAFD